MSKSIPTPISHCAIFVSSNNDLHCDICEQQVDTMVMTDSVNICSKCIRDLQHHVTDPHHKRLRTWKGNTHKICATTGCKVILSKADIAQGHNFCEYCRHIAAELYHLGA